MTVYRHALTGIPAKGAAYLYNKGSIIQTLYFYAGEDITAEVEEFLEENPPLDGVYPSYVEGYFKLKYSLSAKEMGIKVNG